MPSKDRDRDGADIDERPREKRRSSKSELKSELRIEGFRDRDRDREKEHRHRHKSSRSSKTRPSDSDVYSDSHRRRRTKDERSKEDRPASPAAEEADTVPELHLSRERVSIPYPSFSKAHSKENVHSREDVSATAAPRRTDPLTPEATDLGSEEMKRSKSADYTPGRKVSASRRDREATRNGSRPPSPPETNLSGSKDRSETPASTKSKDKEGDERPRSRLSFLSRPDSRSSEKKSKLSNNSKTSSQATFIKSPTVKPPSFGGLRKGDPSSAATSVAPKQGDSAPQAQSKPEPIDVDFSPESAQDSSPKTPTQTPQFPPHILADDKALPHHLRFDAENRSATQTPATDFSAMPAPPPPPPPPPTLNIQEAPRVDYLMQNGGLPHVVPRNFLAVLPRQNGTRPSNPPLQGAETLFAPFFNLLNQYQSVLSNSGSIAVATGHRTVARRLLDRLENVFSRDLPAEGCACVICERSGEPHRGLGWGEVLERVSGRVEIPQWPPFDFGEISHKAAEAAEVPKRPSSPIKMDPDIHEDYREHYLRQNKKTRATVDQWMANCAQAPAPAPQEIDDETLTFAILTNLGQDDRPFFNALLTGSKELQPAIRAPTPMRKPRQDFVVKSGLSIQRLYRLNTAPRDAETILYLVRNHHMHDLLHTVSDINPSEWEILISGRFDGFLWSGADDDIPTPTAEAPSRGATPASGFFPPPRGMSPAGPRVFSPTGLGSRNTTPFSGLSGAFSRGATPASFMSSAASTAAAQRTAVSHDEETEVAALADLERQIFCGMEALEDAFERLHTEAEVVRTALRTRGTGLQLALQQRRGGAGGGIDVLPQSGGGVPPAAWTDDSEEGASDISEDWGGEDIELVPEDSASNVSSSKMRRPKRRNERRTPAPIEEEWEE
jgi:hypothetical protein